MFRNRFAVLLLSSTSTSLSDIHPHYRVSLFPLLCISVRLVESNIRILERECDVRQQTLEAMRSRAGTLYLGLDISTQSTGYAVLTPMPVAADNSVEETVLLTEFARAKLMEWGYIEGSGMGTKRKDVLDVGEVIEKRLLEIARRCVDSRSKCARGDHDSIQGAGEDGNLDLFTLTSCRGSIICGTVPWHFLIH